MKERPILFSGPMVQAILGGRKTMTRRVIKFPYIEIRDDGILASEYHEPGTERPSGLCHKVTCPYGPPGDRLWVRETYFNGVGPGMEPGFYYQADHVGQYLSCPWKSSFFMPRHRSRITLEITAVRVERVQDIGDEDAEAEGLSWCNAASPRDKFQCLWNSLNAKRGYGWEANPWVWVIAFKRVK